MRETKFWKLQNFCPNSELGRCGFLTGRVTLSDVLLLYPGPGGSFSPEPLTGYSAWQERCQQGVAGVPYLWKGADNDNSRTSVRGSEETHCLGLGMESAGEDTSTCTAPLIPAVPPSFCFSALHSATTEQPRRLPQPPTASSPHSVSWYLVWRL